MRIFLPTLILFIALANLHGQQIIQIGDINPGSESSAPFNDNAVIFHDGILYFSADDGINGDELWIYKDSQASLLKDINEGPSGSEIQHMYVVNNRVLFTADTEVNGTELWSTDGTEAGTVLVKEIGEGESNGAYASFFNPDEGFYIYNDNLYFTGIEDGDFELWKSDGTNSGTRLVRNLANFGSSFPHTFVEFEGDLYFSSREGFWKTDGTTSGTVLIEDEDPDDFFGFEPDYTYAYDEFMIMMQGDNVWVSDGTSSGTEKIMDFENVNINGGNTRFSEVNGRILFAADDGSTGDELWSTDGTAAGTQLVKDVWPGSEGYAPQNMVVFKDQLFYKGDDGETDIELYVSDGTEAGTNLFYEFNPGFSSGFSLPTTILADDNFMYMNAGKPFSKELWISDGTTDNTYEIDLNPNGESRPSSMYLFDGKLFCFATTDDTGFEPYIIDLLQEVVDADGDGFTDDLDCDDSNAAINPDQDEIPYNGLDDDCDPMTFDDDLDQDGFLVEDDCDDSNPDINPDADDIPNNGIDEDCDGMDMTSSTHDLGNVSISIYPNPATEIVKIDQTGNLEYKISLFDFSGRLIFQSVNDKEIKVSTLSNGTYLLKVQDVNSAQNIIEQIIIAR